MMIIHGGTDQAVVYTDSPPNDCEQSGCAQPVLPSILENEACDADADEEPPKVSRSRKGRKKRWFRNILQTKARDFIIASKSVAPEHAEMIDKEATHQVIKEEGKTIVPLAQVRNSVGAELERWKLAAESELTKNFLDMGAFHESTPEEIRQHGRPLPMLCVWSKIESEDYAKCRACVCGNFADVDPTQQNWTAQAEPSSLLASWKIGRVEWMDDIQT